MVGIYKANVRQSKKGGEMETKNSLETYLKLWKTDYKAKVKHLTKEKIHLSTEAIYRMAGSGGIAMAEDKMIDHLSLCPGCLEEWVEWIKAIESLEDLESIDEQEPPIMTYGMREAAATGKAAGPVSIKSSCGRFILELLPQIDNPDRGMVTVETIAGQETAIKNQHITVRDRNGYVLIDGILIHGRLARTCDNLSEIDLSTWTLVVNEEEKSS